MNSMTKALQKAGLVSNEQIAKQEQKTSEVELINSKLKAIGASTQWFTYNLGQMEQGMILWSEYQRKIFSAMSNFGKLFANNPEVRNSIEFHLKRIVEKQKFKLDFDFKSLMGFSLAAELANTRQDSQHKAQWMARALGYALVNVLEAGPRYSLKTKQDVLAWATNQPVLTSDIFEKC